MFEIKIASVLHREELVAEIYYEREQWVEISQESDELLIEFHPKRNHSCWRFSFDEAMMVLESARKKLLN
jgi:hypothetical protein